MTSATAQILLVAAGGALGASARYAITGLNILQSASRFPATLAVNLLGCLLIGIVWGVVKTAGLPREIYLFLVTGILGGFTTFSTFALDNVVAGVEGRPGEAVIYSLISVVGGILLCLGGAALTIRVIRIFIN